MPDHGDDGTAPEADGRLPGPDMPRERDLKDKNPSVSILKERNDAIDALGASLDRLATKIDLDRLAAREDFDRLATREDFDRLAAREGLKNLGKLLEAANKSADVRFALQAQTLADMKELLRTDIRNNEKSIDLLGRRLDDLFASLNRRLGERFAFLDRSSDERSASPDRESGGTSASMGRNFGEWDKRFDALIKGIRWWGFIMAVLLLVILIWGV